MVALLALAVVVTRRGGFGNLWDWLADLLYRVPGLIIGITVHEFAHAKVANMLGDPTPKIQGRLSLNPLRHFDLFGALALIFIGFGWGKPVMVSPYYFRNKRRDGFFVAIAGVVTNFFVAFIFAGIWMLLAYIGFKHPGSGLHGAFWGRALISALQGVIVVNLALMVFNLLPVPPLDGFNIVTEIFDLRKYDFWQAVYSFGFPILIALVFMGVTSKVMTPAVGGLLNGLTEMWASLLGRVF